MNWHCASFDFDQFPLVMGIVNVTPDSFSDGGLHDTPEQALAFAHSINNYCDLIDIGGESTRPGSDELDVEEELRRVLPVVSALAAEGLAVSIDTRHVAVARACVAAGAVVINDISGFRDPAMIALAQECDAGCVVMHMLGEPKAMQDDPHYDDVVGEVSAYLLEQTAKLEAAGVAHERICIDPGPGFGKDFAHNLALLKATGELASHGYPLMAAWSRKAFVGTLSGETKASERVAGSVTVAAWAATQGAAVLRVHDVKATAQALYVLNHLTHFS
jgi:dihydropteroate synthase